MSNFEIVIGKDLSYPDTVFTEVCLKMEDICFPDNVWSDFTYSILSMWVYTICNNRKAKELQLPFMDGPFSIILTRHSEGTCQVKCMKNCLKEDKLQFEFVTSDREFLHELRRAFLKLKALVSRSTIIASREKACHDIDHCLAMMQAISLLPL